MKIAVVGAGWYGCHIAKCLIESGYCVEIFEKKSVFSGISSRNQNRLHLGYHYPRSAITRRESYNGFQLFSEQYGFCIKECAENFYAIHNDSIIDFETYCQIFNDQRYSYKIVVDHGYKNFSGVIEVGEKVIDWEAAASFFHKVLHKYIILRAFSDVDADKYDLVVNTSCNEFNPVFDGFYYEKFAYLKVAAKNSLPNIIVVDGPFFSIYPAGEGVFTITHVSLGILGEASVRSDLEFISVDDGFIERIISDVESTLGISLKDEISDIKVEYAIKVKKTENTAQRAVHILETGNILNIIPGKIDAIFTAEQGVRAYVEQHCSNRVIKSICKR